ncbi:MAG TPA: sigma 54-interacting transcriptional regulator [bacterium]|nr:sigma 54-interacting transcriptional regulator [bacterium]
MKPLPHHPVAPSGPPLQQIQSLLNDKKWTEAAAQLADAQAQAMSDPLSSTAGEWCLLKARLDLAQSDHRSAVDWARRALAAFERSAVDDFLGDTHSALGLSYLGLGDTKNALIHVRDALAIYRRVGDTAGVIRAHNDMARVYFVRGEHGNAVEHLDDALQLARAQRDTDREAMLLGNLGRVHLLQGRWDDAQTALTQAHARAVAIQNWTSAGRNLLSLGYLATLRHEFREAVSRLDAALTAIEKAGLVREKAIYFEYSGWCEFEQHHWIAAKEAFRRALELGRRIGAANDLISQALRGLAECEAALGDWTEARRLAQEGLEVAIQIGERAEAGSLYRILARGLAHQRESAEALACLEKSGECLQAVGDPYELARLAEARADVLDTIGAPERGMLAALDEAATLYARLGARDQLSQVQMLAIAQRRARGLIAEALTYARRAMTDDGSRAGISLDDKQLLSDLSDECVARATSSANEFRLAAMPWSAADGDELQAAIEFCRSRLGASHVILIEVTSGGQRSGRVLASSGTPDDFANAIAALATNPYQHDVRTDRPHYFWMTALAPQLYAHLAAVTDVVPVSVITVPVDLGPQSTGLLYVDALPDAPRANGAGFEPRDLDFVVAYAEVVAWRSTRLRSEGLLRDVQRLRNQLGRECEFPNIITQNAEFHDTLSRVRLIVDSDVSVLLNGETGTGKDLLARAIHYSSRRRDKRFVSVNCAALPETLLESELFGVKRGAFTGADRDKPGLFEEADGGTFFLDEIGEMPLSIQAKLLRFLESKELTRLGDTKPRRIDVRVISATNRDLTSEMERGAFRRDLFYRLTPVAFTLPPLRERREDIPLLIDHFLAELGAEGRAVRFSVEAVRVLSAYDWPGNIRELENEIRKTVLLTEPGATIGPERLSRKFFAAAAAEETPAAAMPDRFSLYDHIAQIERRYIVQALNEAGGIKKHAAARLGIPESTLRLKMKQYSLDSD